jgi:F-type H+-transporting ATPase subunit b
MTHWSVIAALAGALLVFGVAPAAAAEGGGGAGDLVFPAINLLLLIAVLVYFARKPIQRFFADRREGVQEELQQAAALRDEATRRYAEWQRKLVDLDAEIERLRAVSRERTELERERMLADARAAAERIRADARAAVEQELRSARVQLREEAADLAIGLAAERLRGEVTDADRDRLLDEFIERIGQASDQDGPSARDGGNGSGSGRS